MNTLQIIVNYIAMASMDKLIITSMIISSLSLSRFAGVIVCAFIFSILITLWVYLFGGLASLVKDPFVQLYIFLVRFAAAMLWGGGVFFLKRAFQNLR